LLSQLPLLERGVALVASGALSLIRGLAFASAGVEWLYFELPPPTRWHLACLVVGAAGCIAARSRAWLRPRGAAASGTARATLLWAGACVLGMTAIEGYTVGRHSAALGRALARLRVTALDVGQGDSTLIDLPDGRLMLIDAGGLPGSSFDVGERVLLPILRARRRAHIDLLVLTHPHPDHYGGLAALAAHVSIGEFWYGGSTPAAGAPGELAALIERLRQHAGRVRLARELCEHGVREPDYAIDVLAPCPDLAPDRSANDNSLVVRIRTGARAALFVGDAEAWAEARLREHYGSELHADFLKVGHHGSRSSSSPAFISSVRPELASISCGTGNRFGHPHPETLTTLARAGVQVLRLDQAGSVEWQTDGASSAWRTAEDP
jgi:competence protein ComEC